MIGKIIRINQNDKTGFIHCENGTTPFFFLDNVIEGEPNIGATVEFITKSIKKGGVRATNIRILTKSDTSSDSIVFDPESLNCLKEISNWKLEAKLDNNERYFFRTPQIDLIENGSKCYVIGRKGTGKTAIAEYLHKASSYNVFSYKLTFKNFPFNALYNLNDESFTYPNIYITLWKHIIYSSVAKMMSKNYSINEEIRTNLEKVYSEKLSTSLQNTISRWISHNIQFSVLGSGFTIGAARDMAPNNKSWIDRVDILHNLIDKHAGDSKYYVIFDELDEDYHALLDSSTGDKYKALLLGLFKAVQDVKCAFYQSKPNILPIIFLRDDIYSQLRDSDKTKWLDLAVHLNWPITRIKELLAFRISRALSTSGNIQDFDSCWNKICFATEFNLVGIRRSPFDFIAANTLHRPRDYMQFLKVCGATCVNNQKCKITSKVIADARPIYSKYLRSEFEDEIHPIFPDISNIFDIFSDLGKTSFNAKEFASKYTQAAAIGKVNDRDPNQVLHTLFLFSVIGNRLKTSNRMVLKYFDSNAQLKPDLPYRDTIWPMESITINLIAVMHYSIYS